MMDVKSADRGTMSSEDLPKCCWVCGRGLAGGRGVKVSFHLRPSSRSVSEALQDLTQQEAILSARLCFRCYRLVLGIDHHRYQLERQQLTFYNIYHTAHPQGNIRGNNDKEVNNGDIKCEFTEDSDVNAVSDCDIKVDDDKSSEQPSITPKNDSFITSLERRKKRAKKLKDYHYYEEEGKNEDNGECNGNTVVQHYANYNLAHRKTRISCNSCEEDFSTNRQFVRHDCQESKNKGRRGKVTYTCKGCQTTFPMRRDYIRHIDGCYKNVPVTCDICLVRLPSAAYLPRHLNSFHKGSTIIKKGSLCEQCGRGFSRKESLERHQAMVHGVAHGSHQCPQCGRTFPHTAILAEHLRAHRGYPCVDCGNKRTFSCVSNLLLHRRTHHSTIHSSTTHPFHCLPCSKRWKFHASYTYHMRKYHSGEDSAVKGEEVHRCPGCNLPLTSHKALVRHAQSCPATISKDSATTLPLTVPTIRTHIPALHHLRKGNEVVCRGPKSVQGVAESSGEKPGMDKTTGPARTVLPGNKASSNRGLELQTSITYGKQELGVGGPEETIVVERDRVEEESTQFPLVPDTLTSPSLCPASFSTNPLAPASEIVLEALEDLSGDCQFVILVEDCLSEATESS